MFSDLKYHQFYEAENSILLDGLERQFRLELENFALSPESTQSPDVGVLKVFLNEISDKPLATIKKSTEIEKNRNLVEFSSKSFDSTIKIPDSKTTKLIFVLAKSNGENTESKTERTWFRRKEHYAISKGKRVTTHVGRA